MAEIFATLEFERTEKVINDLEQKIFIYSDSQATSKAIISPRARSDLIQIHMTALAVLKLR